MAVRWLCRRICLVHPVSMLQMQAEGSYTLEGVTALLADAMMPLLDLAMEALLEGVSYR